MIEEFKHAEYLPIHTKRARWDYVTAEDMAVQLIKILKDKPPTFENRSIIAKCRNIITA